MAAHLSERPTLFREQKENGTLPNSFGSGRTQRTTNPSTTFTTMAVSEALANNTRLFVEWRGNVKCARVVRVEYVLSDVNPAVLGCSRACVVCVPRAARLCPVFIQPR